MTRLLEVAMLGLVLVALTLILRALQPQPHPTLEQMQCYPHRLDQCRAPAALDRDHDCAICDDHAELFHVEPQPKRITHYAKMQLRVR